VISRGATALEDLNDDHAAAAARSRMRTRLRFTFTDAVGITGRVLRLWNAEQLTHTHDIVGPVGIGEEAIVADAVEPIGQDMDQKAADELVGIERHQLVTSDALGPVMLFVGGALGGLGLL
jgi:hypothetical protein